MPANVQTMAYVGEPPWHGLGTAVPPEVTAAEMIAAAGLDWEVTKRPAPGARSLADRSGSTWSRFELVRLARTAAEADVVFGLVTGRYEPLQNVEAFSFFDPIVEIAGARYETAGALGDGERVWVMAKMPASIEVVEGDACAKYLLLSNTHTGQGSVAVKFTAIRVVCQNTLMLAMRQGSAGFRIRHTRSMHVTLAQVRDLIAAAVAVYDDAALTFRKLARTTLRAGLLERYLSAVFPETAGQKRGHREPPKWTHVRRLLDSQPDLQLPGVKGTLWAAYNAVTRFEDYRLVNGETAGGRLDRAWFGHGAGLKLRALAEAARLAA